LLIVAFRSAKVASHIASFAEQKATLYVTPYNKITAYKMRNIKIQKPRQKIAVLFATTNLWLKVPGP